MYEPLTVLKGRLQIEIRLLQQIFAEASTEEINENNK
jgi:hypothetical protein